MSNTIDWAKQHIVKTNNEIQSLSNPPEVKDWREKLEPWLSTIFQSDHFSLLIGSGLTTALACLSEIKPQVMNRMNFTGSYSNIIKSNADSSAREMERGTANFEDDLRIGLELLRGYQITGDINYKDLKIEIDKKLDEFIKQVLKTEMEFKEKLISTIEKDQELAITSFNYLNSFLLSFSSRAASRERLNLFTTNYDRFIEYGCDEIGVLLIDRFKGKIEPIFRNTKLELDYHYNPPGIRGEPRYVEGVVRVIKLHGSIDWQFQKHGKIIRSLLPFGASSNHPGIPKNSTEQAVIYPNSAKDIETAYYPYSELFRDFSSAICKPNSSIVTYGYSFGDSHINRIISDMFTIPSTHLVIIAHSDTGNRIQKFLRDKNEAQYTLLIGNHFGDLKILVDNYLPKSAIDRLTVKMIDLLNKRASTSATTKGGTP